MPRVQLDVSERRLELGLVESLEAQSFGEPGSRTFRLLARVPDGQISIWLEKEQLVMLAAAIAEILDRRGRAPSDLDAPRFSSTFTGELEVKAGSLGLGYDTSHRTFVFQASEFLTEPVLDLDEIVFSSGREQVETVKEQIDEIARGGRPRCPLCGRALTEGGHFCPPSNGHARLHG